MIRCRNGYPNSDIRFFAVRSRRALRRKASRRGNPFRGRTHFERTLRRRLGSQAAKSSRALPEPFFVLYFVLYEKQGERYEIQKPFRAQEDIADEFYDDRDPRFYRAARMMAVMMAARTIMNSTSRAGKGKAGGGKMGGRNDQLSAPADDRFHQRTIGGRGGCISGELFHEGALPEARANGNTYCNR